MLWTNKVIHKLITVWASFIVLSVSLAFSAKAATDLVFVVDGSGSISSSDWNIQRSGIVAALQDPLVVPRDGSVKVAVVQFSVSARVEFALQAIDSEQAAQTAINAVNAMRQYRSGTGPGRGIETSTAHLLTRGAIRDDFQSYCLSTDGSRNTGPTVASTLAAAKSAPFELDRFSVIAIEDLPYFDAADAQADFGPHVFGGGGVFVIQNFTEFASFVGSLCLGEPLTIVGLEVTQVIQDLENSVGLIEGKKTLVRTYIEPTDGNDPVKATARLKGSRNGIPLAGSPLTAVNAGGAITAKPNALDRRDVLSDSLNFQLPDSWLTGNVELELEGVGGTLTCEDVAAPAPNDCSTIANFSPASELEVKLVKIKYTDGGSTVETSNSDLNELQQRLLATFPVSSIDRTHTTLDMGNGKPQVADVLASLESMRFLDFCWKGFPIGCERLYYGAVNQGGTLLSGAGATGGQANAIPGSVSAGVMVDGNSYGRNRHGHEIAHTMGIHHAVSASQVGTLMGYKKGPCGSFGDSHAPDFPYVHTVSGTQRSTIGPMNLGDDKLIFGWDSQRNLVVDPSKTFAMMSYCPGYRWPSKFNYGNISNYINSTFDVLNFVPYVPPADLSLLKDWRLLRGIINVGGDSIEFKAPASFSVDDTVIPPTMPGDEYWLVASDDLGNELERISFSPSMMHSDAVAGSPQNGPSEEKGLMMIPVLFNDRTAQYSVINQASGNEIGMLPASANKPDVEVVFPNGGEILNPPMVTLVWSASDLDGDSLSYTVQFSDDNGVTWETLVSDYTDTMLDVDLNDLGKTDQGLIRVQASDGFHVASDESDGPFVTPNSAPECTINQPMNNAAFVGVQPILLDAYTYDAEDGEVATVQWSSSINGNIGNGANIVTELGTGTELGIRRLSEGQHTITMTCTDQGGLQTTDSVMIDVSLVQAQIKGDADNDGDVDRNDLILISSDRNKATTGSACGSKCDMNDDGNINIIDMRLAVLECTRPGCALE
ncbi:DUF1194 domain-containing protein [Echinimonas agarilytica]|uniref:DUF1194 domain-containing protein n=1 Tax=Echinimonas agarilytica TaxID=1215918 RepID=A0AA41W6U6_9GAMM|nr:DUF1194 domain-containing protein [Echinimonas agarilytica]MCM2680175.1 DUF1194 domain-containing protein [Echinimonas agarilytica]